ncbi:nuclear mitotic apparatus protein 1-like [Zonotrichia albicollis]|uniref:nuclear mitotic apparatus protein 1-like n=1 Tax=Zonotrichia albicollis TaxID=44394 RepID=UPI003D81020D
MLGNDLEHQSDEQQLRELGGELSLEKRRLGGDCLCPERVKQLPEKRMQPDGDLPGASTRSLSSFPSQETLAKLEASSPEKTPGHSVLLGLPGYRPVTRSSLRLQRTSSSSLGQSTMKLGMCQDEPEQLDDWNRIAELQRRNQARPPHLKTSYPLESMPSTSLGTITDEDVKMGDPEETLQRGSRQSSLL